MVDNAQNCESYFNILSSQILRQELKVAFANKNQELFKTETVCYRSVEVYCSSQVPRTVLLPRTKLGRYLGCYLAVQLRLPP
jgi:hypothetical protein